MKTWVVADIHGESEKLRKAFKNTPINSGDRIIFLGDYVDRGGDSYGVIEFILNLKKTYSVITLKGNHDLIFVESLMSGNYLFWNQGQKETLDSYLKNCAPHLILKKNCDLRWSDIPKTHQDFYSNLISYHLDPNGDLFVHGGINRHLQLSEQNDDIFVWDRDMLNSARSFHYSTSSISGYTFKIKTNGVKRIFVGHTPVQYFKQSTPQVYGPITVLDLGSGKFDGGMVCFLDKDSGLYFTN